MKTAQDIILKPVITEKSMDGLQAGKYTFKVAKDATKPEIKRAVEKLFGVEVSSVSVNFKVGDSVRISGTAMDGFIGVVQNINLDDRSVDLLVSMFGRETPTTLPINQVIKVED